MTPGSRFVGALLLGLIVAGSVASLASAASEPPSPEPSSDPGVEFWLDEAMTPDAAVGASLNIGVTLWDPSRKNIPPIEGLYLRLYPASGKAKPSTVGTQADWPGHLTGTVTVPTGGPGRVEVGFSGQQCTNDGSPCKEVEFPFAYGGVGPPPEASRAALVDADVHLQPGEPVAGRPFDVIVDIQPRAPWNPADLAFPNRLITIITRSRGPEVANFEIHPASGPGSPYTGQVSLPEAGDYTIFVAVPGSDSEDQPIDSAVLRLKVLAPESAPAGDQLVAVDEPVPWPLIGGALVLLVAMGVVVRRAFADL